MASDPDQGGQVEMEEGEQAGQVENTEKQGRLTQRLMIGFTSSSLVLGSALLMVGCTATAQSNLLDLIADRYPATALLVLLTGLAVTAVSALGLAAALRTSYYLMVAFLTLLLVGMVFEVWAVVTSIVPRGKGLYRVEVARRLADSQAGYGAAGWEGESEAWDRLQTELACCGVETSEEWPAAKLPASCCAGLPLDAAGRPGACRPTSPALHRLGCRPALAAFLRAQRGLLGGAAGLVAALQAALITAALLLLTRWTRPRHCFDTETSSIQIN